MSRRQPPRCTVYRFYVRLRGFDPAIWRVVCVADCLLDDLFQALLVSLGWRGEHSLRCTALEMPFHSLVGIDPYDWPRFWLSQILSDDDVELRLRCELGRDDPWRFEIVYQGCATSVPGASYPLCVAGAQAGIPDDGIAPRTFRADQAARTDSGLPRNTAQRQTYDYVPIWFDLAAINFELGRLCKRQNPIANQDRPFRVHVSPAERELFFEHARVHGLAFTWLKDHEPPSVLRMHGADAGAAARSLALAANRVEAGKTRRQLERLAGRFYRRAVEHQERRKRKDVEPGAKSAEGRRQAQGERKKETGERRIAFGDIR